MKPIQFLLVALGLLGLVAGFSSTDHDIFRLRDEIIASEGAGTSFYDFLGVTEGPSATVEDIKKALKKKSRALHPDKVRHSFVASKSTPAPKKPGEKKKKGTHASKGPSQREISNFMKDATARYQRLSVVAGILQSTERERYDHFLKHGFPAWKGTGYYYSRYRPGLGTVIFGLFLAGGGLAHYFALTISYRRQRDFMDRYIRSARKQAWGDETGIVGITAPAPVATPDEDSTDPAAGLNRKQKREMERQQKKEKKNGNGKPKATPKPEVVQPPTGERRRVVAENGKVLVVDSIGNVFLEEEDEDGNVEEFPLDLDEIKKPTLHDTAVVQLPIWLFRKAFDPYLKNTQPVSSDEVPPTQSEKQLESEIVVSGTNMSSSQISDNGFEIVDATGVESDKNGKKRRKGKK